MKKRVVIGVAGGSGSGKTTIVEFIKQEVGEEKVLVLQQDSYYFDHSELSLEERAQINYDHPDAFENSLLITHLKKLLAGQSVEVPCYDFKTHSRLKSGIVVQPLPVIIVEGILVLFDEVLRSLLNIKIFVDTDDDLRFIRRMLRDIRERGRTMESVVQQYLKTVKPMHDTFVEPTKKFADIIIPEGHKLVSTSLLVAMIRDTLKELKND